MFEKIKVLEITEAFGLGGTEQAVQIRSEFLNKDIFDVVVIGFYNTGPRKELLDQNNIKTKICNGNFDELKKIILVFKPDIIHYYRGESKSELNNNILNFAAIYKIPTVFETNVFGRKAINDNHLKPNYIVHMSYTSMLRYSNLSGYNMAELYENNHRVIYLPVPVQKFNKYSIQNSERNVIRDSLGISSDEIVALRVARPDLRKWSSRLEVALPQILRFNPNLKIIFMAAPPSKEKHLKKKFGKQVIFLAPTESIRYISQIYQISDFMLHSSGIGESFGLSMAEGMFWGLPIIVDSTPNLDNAQIEVVDHNKNGIIVNSAAGFVEAVSSLINDRNLLTKLANSAHNKALEYFADYLIVRQWEKVYIESLYQKIPLSKFIINYWNDLPRLQEKDIYINFYESYKIKLTDIFIKKNEMILTLKEKYYNFIKSLLYAHHIGLKTLLTVLQSRIVTKKIFKRA